MKPCFCLASNDPSVAERLSFRRFVCARASLVNDDLPLAPLAALKAEHRRLDQQLAALVAEPLGNQLDVARLKRAKLKLKDEIAFLEDQMVPDIIA